MKTRIVEVTNGPRNWGKFLLGQLRKEWEHPSAVLASSDVGIFGGRSLLRAIGTNPLAVWVLDLQTCEGASFVPGATRSAKSDLKKHRIWVCPMYEPFLVWFYAHPEHHADVTSTPVLVDLPDAEFAMSGYRREGAG